MKTIFQHNSYNHLLYLHPWRFNHDATVPGKYGLETGKYIVVRLVSWKTYHDVGQQGVGNVEHFLSELRRFYPLVISSEIELGSQWDDSIFRGNTRDMIHLQAGARLYVGEGSAMAMESALLGVPSIIISSFLNGFIRAAAADGLIYTFLGVETDAAIACAHRLLTEPMVLVEQCRKRDEVIEKRGDPLPFLVNLIRQMVGEKG